MRYLIIFTAFVFMANNSNAEPAKHGREAKMSQSREYGYFRPVRRMISDYRKDHRSDHRRDHRSDHRKDHKGYATNSDTSKKRIRQRTSKTIIDKDYRKQDGQPGREERIRYYDITV